VKPALCKYSVNSPWLHRPRRPRNAAASRPKPPASKRFSCGPTIPPSLRAGPPGAEHDRRIAEKGWGSNLRQLPTMRFTASISSHEIVAGRLAKPTKQYTPWVARIASAPLDSARRYNKETEVEIVSCPDPSSNGQRCRAAEILQSLCRSASAPGFFVPVTLVERVTVGRDFSR